MFSLIGWYCRGVAATDTQRSGARTACNTTPRRWQASQLQAYAALVRDEHGSGWRAKLSLPRNSQADSLDCPKKLSSACLVMETSLRKRYFITVQERVYSLSLHVPAPEHRCVGCTNCPHQPFFRSQPYRRADRVRDRDACDRRSNPLPSAMTAIVSKISPKPHYGDEEMRAGAAWRGWCCLLTACHTQLGFTMRCAYSRVAYNCQAGRRSRSRC